MFGLGTRYHAHWFVPVFGEYLVNFGLFVGGNIMYTYVTDVYLERADVALVVINGLKNLTAFGFVYSVTPWNTHSGYGIAFGGLAIISFFGHLPMLFLYLKGATIRAWQAEKFVNGGQAVHGKAFN